MLEQNNKISFFSLLMPIFKPRIWIKLASKNLMQDYQRTMLGPIWIFLNLVIFTLSMSIVYSGLLSVDYSDYLVYMSCSMIAWIWAGSFLSTSGSVYISNSSILLEHAVEKEYFIWSHVTNNFLVFLHQLPLLIIYYFIGVIELTVNTLYIIPSLIIFFIINIGLSSCISLIVVRFRDVQKILSSLVIIIMITTPIFWKPEMLTGIRAYTYLLNPFYYFIELIRTPLLGNQPNINIYLISIGFAFFLTILGCWMNYKYGKTMVYRL